MKPALLLLPGILNDEGIWADVAPLLRDAADVRVAGVLPPTTIAQMADAAWALLADVPVATPVVLAGFSMGGYVALEMLAKPRRPLAAAGLVSTSARPESPEAAANREKSITAMGRDFGKAMDALLQWSTHEPSADVASRIRATFDRVGGETAIRQNRAVMARADHREALARLSVPVVVVCGRHDRITPPPLSEEMARLIPGAQLQLVEGAGHMLPLEQPASVATALRGLLAAATMTHSQPGDQP